MGPLWAWGILWFISIYGLVYLLRLAMARAVVEPVAVLVANAKPSESPSAAESPAGEAEVAADDAIAPSEPEPAFATGPAADLGDDVTLAAPGALEPAEHAVSAPRFEEPEIPLPAGSWAEAQEAGMPESSALGPEEVPEPEDPSSPEAVEAFAAWGEAPDEELEPVEYRSIDLESLTLGLEASEIQELYGSPGHLSKLGEDGEQWRYPLNATDEGGAGVEGVLVLEFQRGRLVRKALEENEVERRKA